MLLLLPALCLAPCVSAEPPNPPLLCNAQGLGKAAAWKPEADKPLFVRGGFDACKAMLYMLMLPGVKGLDRIRKARAAGASAAPAPGPPPTRAAARASALVSLGAHAQRSDR